MGQTLVYHVASGHAFFSGVALIQLGVFLSLLPADRRLIVARTVSACSGLILIAVSATPLPNGFYAVAGSVSLIWLVVESHTAETGRSRRIWFRGAVVVLWSLGVAFELPYHRLPTMPRLGNPRVYVIGDSLAAGLGGEAETWPELLARSHGIVVQDLALAGANVGSAGREQAGRVIESGALVLAEIGGNDILSRTAPRVFERELDALLARLRSGRRTVVLFELPLPPFDNPYGAIQRRLARQHGALLVPKRVLLGVLTTRGATLDTIHLSPSGHARMAEAVWGIIRPAFGPRHHRAARGKIATQASLF